MALYTPQADVQLRLTGPQSLHWFLQICRAILIVLSLGGVLAWLVSAAPTPRLVESLLLAGIVAAYNAVFELLLDGGTPTHPRPLAQAIVRWAQLPCDILLTTLLLHVLGTGGISPFTILYGITVWAAATLLPARGIYIIAGFATLCYGGLLINEFFWRDPGTADTLLAYFRSHADLAQVALSAFVITAVALNSAAYATSRFAHRLRTTEAVIQRQVADLTMLQRTAHEQVATLNVDEVLQKITDSTQALLNADLVSVVLRRPDGQAEFRVISGPDSAQWPPATIFPLPEGNTSLTQLLAGQPLLVPDIAHQPALRALLVRPQTVSFYSFPLIVDQHTIGALNFSFDRSYHLPPDTLAMLLALTDQAALALARARLYQAATQAAREMSSLYDIGLATSSSLNIEEVLKQIYQQVQQMLAPDTFFIALDDARTGELHFELVTEQGQVLPLHKVPLGTSSMSSWVAAHRRSLLVSHWDADRATFRPSGASMGWIPSRCWPYH